MKSRIRKITILGNNTMQIDQSLVAMGADSMRTDSMRTDSMRTIINVETGSGSI